MVVMVDACADLSRPAWVPLGSCTLVNGTGAFSDMHPLEILALMQHYHLPTRLVDFSFCPFVAAFFAIEKASATSAIYVLERAKLRDVPQRGQSDENYRPWPTHQGGYARAIRDDDDPGFFRPESPDLRLQAQRGCFLVPEHISGELREGLIKEKVELSDGLIFDGLQDLRGMGIDRESLFPNLDRIARQILPVLCGGGPALD